MGVPIFPLFHQQRTSNPPPNTVLAALTSSTAAIPTNPSPTPQSKTIRLKDVYFPYRTQAWSYLPCNATSLTHDLTCGHHVTSASTHEPCGPNCAFPSSESVPAPLICRSCIAVPALSKVGLVSDVSVDMDETQGSDTLEAQLAVSIVDVLIKDQVHVLTAKGQRDTVQVVKTDGLREFVRDFGTKVLKETEQKMMTVENTWWGRQLETLEEKAEALKQVFSALRWVSETPCHGTRNILEKRIEA